MLLKAPFVSVATKKTKQKNHNPSSLPTQKNSKYPQPLIVLCSLFSFFFILHLSTDFLFQSFFLHHSLFLDLFYLLFLPSWFPNILYIFFDTLFYIFFGSITPERNNTTTNKKTLPLPTKENCDNKNYFFEGKKEWKKEKMTRLQWADKKIT